MPVWPWPSRVQCRVVLVFRVQTTRGEDDYRYSDQTPLNVYSTFFRGSLNVVKQFISNVACTTILYTIYITHQFKVSMN